MDPNEAQPGADIILGSELVLEGRFYGTSVGQPAKDVEIFTANVGRIVDERVELVPLGRWGQTGKNRSSLPSARKKATPMDDSHCED